MSPRRADQMEFEFAGRCRCSMKRKDDLGMACSTQNETWKLERTKGPKVR
jgi:hypothetical protein